MKIGHLFIATSLMALVLTGCEAQKPITEATAEPVVATEAAAPVATPEVAVLPTTPAAESSAQHCAHHQGVGAHDCAKHCKETKKPKKDKVCKVHCDSKAVAEHDCTKHCDANHDVKDKVCAQHCASDLNAKPHACGPEHCAEHKGNKCEAPTQK